MLNVFHMNRKEKSFLKPLQSDQQHMLGLHGPHCILAGQFNEGESFLGVLGRFLGAEVVK